MTDKATEWRLALRVEPSLPPLAWIARVRHGCVDVAAGKSVRHEDGAFFEGTWAGPPALASLPEQTTLFGSGMVVRGGQLFILTPSHHLEGLYFCRVGDEVCVSNSLVGVLSSAGVSLDPTVDYPSIFGASNELWRLIDEDTPSGGRRLVGSWFSIPTLSEPVTAQFFENLIVERDLSVSEARKAREGPFASFDDYRRRLTDATASLFANALAYEPVVSLSAGYDSTAVAAVASRAGCRRAIGFRTARPSPRDGSVNDSGEATAALLGLEYQPFDRLAYLHAADIPEAEFLATGMGGEEIIFHGMEQTLNERTLLTGYWAGTQWAFAGSGDWRGVAPSTTSGAGMAEFRLRANFYDVPLPCFGAVGKPDEASLLERPEMAPFRVGGRYDRPIPRRLAEEAGIARGTFGFTKHAANVVLPVEGVDGFTERSRRSLEAFAAAEGRMVPNRRRRPFGRSGRAAVKVAERVGAKSVASRLRKRQKSLVHFEPELGNLLLRWSVSVVQPRYESVRRAAKPSAGRSDP
jgi:hypothetical protein